MQEITARFLINISALETTGIYTLFITHCIGLYAITALPTQNNTDLGKILHKWIQNLYATSWQIARVALMLKKQCINLIWSLCLHGYASIATKLLCLDVHFHDLEAQDNVILILFSIITEGYLQSL